MVGRWWGAPLALAVAWVVPAVAQAHEFVCVKTVNGAATGEVTQYPADVTWGFRLENTHPTETSVALEIEDPILAGLGLSFGTLPLDVPVDGVETWSFTQTIDSRTECLELAAADGRADAHVDNTLRVEWDLGETHCRARLTCGGDTGEGGGGGEGGSGGGEGGSGGGEGGSGGGEGGSGGGEGGAGGGEGGSGGGEGGSGGGGKVTICHATGSASNPYVEITIDESAIPAHEAHQQGEDIIPAPPEGCPGPSGEEEPPGEKITICHATGSETNPYVEITISVNAVPAHEAHQHGEDIIPAPPQGCPDTVNGGIE